MHLITGFLLASLAGLKKNGKADHRARIPQFKTGPVQTVHALPGRIRLRIPSLKEDSTGQATLEGQLPRLAGVEAVDVNPISGTVLIRYRKDEVEPEMLFAALVRLLDLEEAMDRPCQSLLTRELKSMGESLNRCVHEKTGGVIDLWSAFLIVMAGIGIRKMMQDPARAFPAGFTMIWWGVSSLRRKV